MSAGPSASARWNVFKRDNWTCQSCGFRQTEHTRQKVAERGGLGRYLTVDHIVPRSKGGRNAMSNLQSLCNICNREKADSLNPADATPERVRKPQSSRSKLLSGLYRSKGGRMLIHDPRCDAQFCMNTCPVYLERGVHL